MQFVTNKADLFRALTKVKDAVPQRTTIEILAGFLLELSGNKLTIIGTDLEVCVKGFSPLLLQTKNKKKKRTKKNGKKAEALFPVDLELILDRPCFTDNLQLSC